MTELTSLQRVAKLLGECSFLLFSFVSVVPVGRQRLPSAHHRRSFQSRGVSRWHTLGRGVYFLYAVRGRGFRFSSPSLLEMPLGSYRIAFGTSLGRPTPFLPSLFIFPFIFVLCIITKFPSLSVHVQNAVFITSNFIPKLYIGDEATSKQTWALHFFIKHMQAPPRSPGKFPPNKILLKGYDIAMGGNKVSIGESGA